MMHTITLSCSSSPLAILFPQTLTSSWFTSIHHRRRILFSKTGQNIFQAGGLYKETPLAQTELLHKLEAVLVFGFLLPLLLPALIVCAQCSAKGAEGTSNPYFTELHQGMGSSSCGINETSIPWVQFWALYCQNVIKKLDESFGFLFLLCKRFPG